jgi:hypothetical protein
LILDRFPQPTENKDVIVQVLENKSTYGRFLRLCRELRANCGQKADGPKLISFGPSKRPTWFFFLLRSFCCWNQCKELREIIGTVREIYICRGMREMGAISKVVGLDRKKGKQGMAMIP